MERSDRKSEASAGGRNEQMGRILCLLRKLVESRRGFSRGELHRSLADDGFQVSPRTVHRDLGALELAGFALVETGLDEKGGVRFAFFDERERDRLAAVFALKKRPAGE